MAHKGRHYPLSKIRSINADAPYPQWLARRYEIGLPPATGFFGAYLSNTIHRTTIEFEMVGTIAATIINFGPGPIFSTFSLQLNIGFVPDEFFPRIISLDLLARDPFTGPTDYLLCTWANQLPPEHGLHFFAPAVALIGNPGNYNTTDSATILAIPWGG